MVEDRIRYLCSVCKKSAECN